MLNETFSVIFKHRVSGFVFSGGSPHQQTDWNLSLWPYLLLLGLAPLRPHLLFWKRGQSYIGPFQCHYRCRPNQGRRCCRFYRTSQNRAKIVAGPLHTRKLGIGISQRLDCKPYFFKHTVTKSQIVFKNSILRKIVKIVNLNFRAKN